MPSPSPVTEVRTAWLEWREAASEEAAALSAYEAAPCAETAVLMARARRRKERASVRFQHATTMGVSSHA